MSRFSHKEEPKKVSGFGEPETYKSKVGAVAWYKNYWYYYKVPIIITVCLVTLVVWFAVDMLTKVEQDTRLYVICDAGLIDTQYSPIEEIVTPYAGDFNGDGEVSVGVSYINLSKNPQTEIQTTAYQQILTIFYDEAVSVMLVDDYAYNYLQQAEGIAKLSEYGVTGGMDEYRVPIDGTSLGDACPMLTPMGTFYLVFRVCPESDAEEPQVVANYEAMAQFVQAIADEYQASLSE